MKFDCVFIISLLFVFAEAISYEKLSKLRLKEKKSIIKLKNTNFESILQGPRNFSVAVLLTATSSNIGCVLCTQFDPDFTTVADSWVKDHPKNDGLFFAKADFTESLNKVFQSFQLQAVPKLFLFKPTNDSKDITKDFEEFRFMDGDNLDMVSGFLSDQLGVKLNVVAPVRYDNVIFSLLVVAGLGFGTYRFSSGISKVLSSKKVWGAGVIFAVLLFISGYMFNNIRGTQYMGGGPSNPEYFQDGQQNQFGIETNIISTIYGLLAILVVLLIKTLPNIKNPRASAIAVFVTSFLILFIYSLLFDVFAKKSWGYPFKLLQLFHF